MTRRPPITDKVTGLRQRQRADGSWRIWWEPNGTARAQGFDAAVELDALRPTWSVREARKLNDHVTRNRKGQPPRQSQSGGRTINALIHEFKRSRRYASKSHATRRGYNDQLNRIGNKWGGDPVVNFSKPVLHAWYETLFDNVGVSSAIATLRVFSILFSYAEILGWRSENSNPCFRLGMQKPRSRHRSATWHEFDALLDAADQMGWQAMACAIALATFQAQRQTDLINAQISAFRQTSFGAGDQVKQIWIWELIRSKRDNYGVMPLHEEAQTRVLALIKTAKLGQEHLLIDEATGKPYSRDLFQKRWAKIRAKAASAVPSLTNNQLQFRDLRRTFGVWARAGGASKEDTGDVLGNSAALDPQLGETYMPPSFHTTQRAVQAIVRPQTDDDRKKA